MKKLLIIDGNNVMFRAYYATASMGNLMRNKEGFPTNMVYGFINIYTKVIKDGYTHVVVAFDKGSHTKRHQLYKDYKAGRAVTPDELFEQIPYIHDFLDSMNVHYYLSDDYEADDIVATFDKKFYDDFDEIDVLSNDNDLFQLINDHSFQLYTKLKETIKYDSDFLMEEKGITPLQIPDYKGLIGDKSDNLLGVDGIGPVTASKLLKSYKTLDGIYENIESIAGKNKERLIEDKETAFFTRKMATLDPNFIFDESIDDLSIKEPNYDKLKEMYIKLDFISFLKKLPANETPIESKEEKKEAEFSFTEITDPFEIINIIKEDEINYLGLELLKENYHSSPKIGFGLSNSKGNFYIPYDIGISSFDFSLFLGDKRYKKAVYDYKKMFVSLYQDGIILEGVSFDLLLASYLINPDLTKDDFSVISSHFGYYSMEADETIYGKKGKEALPIDSIYKYHVAKKAFVIKNVYNLAMKEITENGQVSLLNDIEIPLSRVLAKMEYRGLRVDTNALDKYEVNITTEMKEIENEIYALVGHDFNILSPKQLGTVLFEELGLKGSKKTKTGYSTDSSVLEKLEFYHPVVSLVLRYRMLSKLEGTYILGVRSAILEKNDNHIHTIYKQTLTDTGRLSSTEPNLQNLPIRNTESREFRRIFIPEDGSYLMSSDYSQIELRVLAHMADETNLINAFINKEDIHEATAKAILKKSSVTKEERSKAKAINFGIIYGISAWGLANNEKISPKEAALFIDEYHKSFPKILPFTNSLIKEAEDNGFVKTLFNRRRYIRDIASSNYNIREFAKKTAMNAPIQGTAADILKLAMVSLDKAIDENMLHAKLILTIHDEIVLDVPKEEIEKTIKITEETMDNVIKLKVPLVVETSYGNNLYEAK